MTHRSFHWLTRGAVVAATCAAVAGSGLAQAAPWNGKRLTFADPRFEQVWRQTDANPGNRSLTWGPAPWFDYKEFYKQSPNGLRQVQYFDKSRMEINDPASNKGPLGGVTNGLLPVEMVSGRAKLGNGTGPDQNDQRAQANIPVAGDLAKVNTDAPTYASFAKIATTDNGYRDSQRVGQRVGATFSKDGTIGFRQELADVPGTDIVEFTAVTGHNVPRVFNDYRNSLPVAAIDAFGYPITDAYWIRARVGGVEKDVMAQLFERRVLTYTPSNNDPYKVEMGNVGQHYFQWRYPELGTPWDTTEPYLPLVFASNRNSVGHLEVFTTDANGSQQNQITAGGAETTPFSLRKSWSQDQVFLVAESRRDDAARRQLYRLSLDGSVVQRLTNTKSDDYFGAASPDGTKIAFTSDRSGQAELYVMNLNGKGVSQLTSAGKACTTGHATWMPDGSGLVYESDCDGNFEIYRAEVKYTQDKLDDLQATLVNPKRLTNNTSADRFPRVSPDGTKIAFEANRDGNPEIYVMNIDGSAQRRLTNSQGVDSHPTWAPDNQRIAFESDRDGRFQVLIQNIDGSNQVQLTTGERQSRMPVWAN
ncbi:MAG: DPP IV N-terminal domain-containing protein [Herpetosiphon sp.]